MFYCIRCNQVIDGDDCSILKGYLCNACYSALPNNIKNSCKEFLGSINALTSSEKEEVIKLVVEKDRVQDFAWFEADPNYTLKENEVKVCNTRMYRGTKIVPAIFVIRWR